MPTTVDVPCTAITAMSSLGAGAAYTDGTLSAEDATGLTPGASWSLMAQFFSYFQSYTIIGKYGTGPKKFNFDLPAGTTVTSLQYVIRAYREGSFSNTGDATALAANATFGSVPSGDLPRAVAYSPSRSGGGVYFPPLPIMPASWAAAGELLIDDPAPSLVLVNDLPFDYFTSVQSESFSSSVPWDYLAIRVTYDTAVSPTQTVAPPLRLTNRTDMFGSARALVNETSRQGSNRLNGYL